MHSNIMLLKIIKLVHEMPNAQPHKGAFSHFPFRWIYFDGNNKYNGSDKTHLCEPVQTSPNLRLCL